ncbi:MAG TPA: hypothetical protein VMZ92_11600 [Planctomycetota bacterium]|nr:hypothetical protein [Planctomycetota bacterium]
MFLSEWLRRRREGKELEKRNLQLATAWVIRLTRLRTMHHDGEDMRCETCGEAITHEADPGGHGWVFKCPKGCTRVAYDLGDGGRLILDPRFYRPEEMNRG